MYASLGKIRHRTHEKCNLLHLFDLFLAKSGKKKDLRYITIWKGRMETAEYLNHSGIALTEANRPFEAIPLFQRALVIDPENPMLWLNLGIAQQKTGEYKEALDSYRQSVRIDDGMAESWCAMGLIYFELEAFDSAEECYRIALERDPNSPKTWNNLGALFFSERSYEEARRCFEEALNLVPMYYDALYNIRDVCRELSDFRAAAEFERVLRGLRRE